MHCFVASGFAPSRHSSVMRFEQMFDVASTEQSSSELELLHPDDDDDEFWQAKTKETITATISGVCLEAMTCA